MKNNILTIYNEMNHFGRVNNMTYEVIQPGEIIYRFTPVKEHLATKTAVHGGVLAAYMDAIIGVAALSAVYQEEKLVATIEFKINFIAPALENEELIGKGVVLSKGKSTLVCKGEILNPQGKTIAIAQGTLKSYPFPK
jgi:acyl-CoA thioesterase